MAERRTWVVPVEVGGQRLDRVVAVLGSIPRSLAREIVDAGDVLVDGEPRPAAFRVPAGRTVVAVVPDPAGPPEPARVPFVVRHEDASLLVVDKPAGVVTHPGAGHRDDTLLNGLMGGYPELFELGEEHRYGIVHRLDRGTSGLLIVARTAAAHRALQRALARREIERGYLAVICGTPIAESGTIDAPIGRDPRHPTRMTLRRDGRPARTHYSVRASWPRHALLEVTLETGRTHQIRVHCTSIGVPLAGDDTYGRCHDVADPGRVWLHSARLAFDHPAHRERVTVASPLPADLVASLTRLGPPSSGSLPS
jgi:23S rRNA pseudouridine1911/1915/1917 synthase